MAISKQKKDELVEQYKSLIDGSRAIFMADYTGMTVNDMETLRDKVRGVDGQFTVTKNTLMMLALAEAQRELPEGFLNGQLAAGFALGEAPALAKILAETAKENEHLALKGGLLGETFLTADEITQLAELPSRDELRAQLIGLIGNPAQGIASVLATSVRQVVNVMDAYSRTEEAAAA